MSNSEDGLLRRRPEKKPLNPVLILKTVIPIEQWCQKTDFSVKEQTGGEAVEITDIGFQSKKFDSEWKRRQVGWWQ